MSSPGKRRPVPFRGGQAAPPEPPCVLDTHPSLKVDPPSLKVDPGKDVCLFGARLPPKIGRILTRE